jgi:predicted transposase/invertase (TIGR01784 family)
MVDNKKDGTKVSRYGLLDDVIFKIVFGAQARHSVFSALLNALLGYTGDDRIVDLTILTPELEKYRIDDKGSLLDLRAVDAIGRQFNVEVQLYLDNRESFIKRTTLYLTKLHSEQISKGDDYAKINKTIGVSLLDFILFPDVSSLHTTFHLREDEHKFLLSDVIEIHYIELRKFFETNADRLDSSLEVWLHTLKYANLYVLDDEPLPQALRTEEGVPMAIDALKDAYADQRVRAMIQLREKARWDENTRIAQARRAEEEGREAGREAGRVEGREEGLEKGREEGLERGREEGLERGREEGLEMGTLRVAREMAKSGVPAETIKTFTGWDPADLPPEEE